MKTKKKLVWHLYLPYLAVILVALVAITWFATRTLRQFHLDQTRTDLENRAFLAKQQVLNLFDLHNTDPLNKFCRQAGRRTSTRLTVILPSGKVVADSFENAAAMEDHSDRPEIITALQGKMGTAVRYSETLTQTMMYVALPIYLTNSNSNDAQNAIGGVIRTSIPLTAIEKRLSSIRVKLIAWGLGIAIFAAVVSLWVARRISQPIGILRDGAIQFAKGEFSHPLPVPNPAEIADLTLAMNDMAIQLNDRITTTINQRKELEAVLSSMLEGVVAVDPNGRIVNINSAAAEIFGTTPINAKGAGFLELSRNHQLQEFVNQAMASIDIINRDIVLFEQPDDRYYNLHSTPIVDESGDRTGTLIVFNDVTQLKRLENIRQDFVANVSHEIKTPLTAIKGFVETLRYGKVENATETRHFLGIIERHVNRLNAILEDLLALSRLEQQEEQNGFILKPTALKNVLQTAAQVCLGAARDKQISLELICPKDMVAVIDETLMEQALINLIDNAVKYSGKNSLVQIKAASAADTIDITIHDQGPGIPKKHLPRIFERFYRVDKARSRDMGGTGLGLAIVKHIVNTHGGKIKVESTMAKGSTFTIQLPATSIP